MSNSEPQNSSFHWRPRHYNDNVDYTRPRYSVVPVVMTPKVNPGEEVKIAIHITGFGPVEKNKLYFKFPHQPFDSDGTIKGVFNHNWVTQDLALPFGNDEWVRAGEQEDDDYFIVMNVDSAFQDCSQIMEKADEYDNEEWFNDVFDFTIEREREELQGDSHSITSGRYNSVLGERTVEMVNDGTDDTNDDLIHRPPYLIKMQTEKPPSLWKRIFKQEEVCGDYGISVILTYGSDDVVFQDKENVEFSVRNIYERNHFLLEVTGVLVLLFVLLQFLIQLGVFSAATNYFNWIVRNSPIIF